MIEGYIRRAPAAFVSSAEPKGLVLAVATKVFSNPEVTQREMAFAMQVMQVEHIGPQLPATADGQCSCLLR